MNLPVLNESEFNSRVFSLLCRYESFFQCSVRINEGYGMQTSLPASAFKALNQLFEVTQEMFASPFNCYFAQFCSAFADTDVYFGSRGSFFDYEPIGGSFQCNPPFTEECIERMADRIEYLLDQAGDKQPLSFIVFIPEWLDPITRGLDKMDKSKFNRKTFVLPRGQHQYVAGAQYLENKRSSKIFNSSHNTKVYFLQNDLANQKWKPTEEKIARFKSVFTKLEHNNTRNDYKTASGSFVVNSANFNTDFRTKIRHNNFYSNW
jgi:phosphorylated CTD-interacting factor 1